MSVRVTMHPRMSRRRLLQATGVAASSLFLPSLLGASQARAQGAPPRRLVVMFTQHGFVYQNFKMRPTGVNATADFDVDLNAVAPAEWSRILAPLRPFSSKLLVVDGLSMASAEGDVVHNEHEKGTRHALTGAPMVRRGDGSYAAGGPSVDQLVARRIAVPGRIDSLEFAVVQAHNGGAVWRDADLAIPADVDPRAAFSRVFPPESGGPPTVDDLVRKRQSSVLDVVAREYDALAPRLSVDDRAKLELHRDLVRDVERRLDALDTLSCERPGAPSVVDDFGQPTFYETRLDAFASITAGALACDLSRVVTLQLGQLRNDQVGISGDVHADWAHTSETSAQAIDVMTRYGEVHADHLRRLVVALDSIPEGNGTVLDNTIVVWCSELATGTHKFNIWPAVVVGGGNCGLRTGRYLRFVPNTPNANPNPGWEGVEARIGMPHNRFWRTIANAAGANLTSVGATQLTTTEGVQVDASAPIPGMLV